MPIIILMTFILYSVVIGWMWNNLGETSKVKKIIIIFIELLIIYLITLITFNISKSDIEYNNLEIEASIRNIIVIIFTGFNGLIILPFINKQVIKLKESESDSEIKKTFKKIAVLLLIFIICIIFECGYIKDIQRGILEMQQNRTQQVK